MRKLEERAFPVVTNLVRSESFTLGLEEQASVAAWVVQACMMAEYFKPDAEAILTPAANRAILRDTGAAPPGWQVWIAAYNGAKYRTAGFHAARRGGTVSTQTKPEAIYAADIHVTLFWIGNLFCHVMFCTEPSVLQDYSMVRGRFRQIAPVVSEAVKWPPPLTLWDRESDQIIAHLKASFGIQSFVDPFAFG